MSADLAFLAKFLKASVKSLLLSHISLLLASPRFAQP